MKLYKKFLRDGVPEYLARYYWWAYLWDKSIWFFDHQPVINTILFGQYETLLQKTLAQVETKAGARLLQLTCVYGKLTPSLLHHTDNEVHLCDVAAGQLQLARRKTSEATEHCHLARMNAESLGYAGEAFDQVMVFFLFHELPAEARQKAYDEIARVVKRGGSVLITEYSSTPHHHWLYRLSLSRWILGTLEPFLPGFWLEDVAQKLHDALENQGKHLAGKTYEATCFAGFYRVIRFNLAQK
jgi:ubiquinone/menaquinone biosynthesis C-methylase UbiE